MRSLVAALLLSSLCLAQTSLGPAAPESNEAAVAKKLRIADFPAAPQPKVWDKKLVLTETLTATAIAFDAYTTVNMHKPCVETNRILGAHPSGAAVSGLFGGQFAATMLINYYAKKSFGNRKWAHAFWMLPTLYVAADHLKGGINNYAIGCE